MRSGDHAALVERKAFTAYLAPLRQIEWYLYSKPPFGGPKAVLTYLARYTHRVAIANSRLIVFDNAGVTFTYKDYRADGRAHYKRMTLAPHEFIRRFLLHVLPDGFHRIRHYGLLAGAARANNIARARELLAAPAPQTQADNRRVFPEGVKLSAWCSCGPGGNARKSGLHTGGFPLASFHWSEAMPIAECMTLQAVRRRRSRKRIHAIRTPQGGISTAAAAMKSGIFERIETELVALITRVRTARSV